MRADLEQAILDDSTDRQAFAVYADALLAEGDPRGELIQIQLRLEEELFDPDERAALVARERELLDAHTPTWLGRSLAQRLRRPERSGSPSRAHVRFERGFLHTLELTELDVELTRALRHSEETRFLQRLVLLEDPYVTERVEFDGQLVDNRARLLPFLPWDKLRRLRELHLGSIDDSNSRMHGHSAGDCLDKLVALESLVLGAIHVDTAAVFAARLPRLRRLHLYHAYDYALDVLADNPATIQLEELRCYPHGLEHHHARPYIRRASIEALLTSPYLGKLRYLELRAAELGDEGVGLLLDSGIVGQLDVLDVQGGGITDAGARLLAWHDDPRKLAKLDISYNAITKAGLQLLQDNWIPFVSEVQFAYADRHRYLSYGCPE